MSDSKHTPDLLWSVSPDTHYVMFGMYEFRIICPTGNPLKFSLEAEREEGDRTRDEAEAHARIMAAAPEGHELLEMVRDFLNGNGNLTLWSLMPHDDCVFGEALDQYFNKVKGE